jgi:hypothetical protein
LARTQNRRSDSGIQGSGEGCRQSAFARVDGWVGDRRETMNTKVRITWNGMGGELDSCVVTDDGQLALSNALIKLVEGQIVSPGDTFVVAEVE